MQNPLGVNEEIEYWLNTPFEDMPSSLLHTINVRVIMNGLRPGVLRDAIDEWVRERRNT